MLHSSYLVRQLTRASNDDYQIHVYVLDLGQRRSAAREADNDSSQDIIMNSSSDNDSEANAARARGRSTRYEIECDPMLP